jgi:hypothetical protein
MRFYVSASIKAVVAALAVAIMPGLAIAQDSCNATISVSAGGGGELFMGEPIPIVIDIGAGQVLDAGQPGYLDISEFEYKLDCNDGETLETCTDAGNTVDFIEDSLWTDCTDEQDPAQQVSLDMDENPDTDEMIVFTPAGGHVIRNDSDLTCQVGFDIVVEAVAPGNNNRVVELTGWINAGGDGGNVGVCSNGNVASAEASVAFNFNVTSTFRVTKDFSDDNTDPVEVHIRCDAGLPLYQSHMLVEGSTVDFTVKDYRPGDLDCQVWETPVDNYVPTYTASATTGVGTPSDDADGCYYSAVEGGGFLCAITNVAGPGDLTVNKEWILGESDGEGLELIAPVTIGCDQPILENDVQTSPDYWYVMRTLEGEIDSITIAVDTSNGDALCEAIEGEMPSGVFVDNGCSAVTVTSGQEASCLITNTMFFEGIPTLSQFGMAILVLLTLGVGMVGFRRYA